MTMTTNKLSLVSHYLCPYVQRVAISLHEKGLAFERIDVDLGNKPQWFKTLSPLGKTPILTVGDTAIFESIAILEYLEDSQAAPLHPANYLQRAEHRAWIEFGSATLNNIGGFYSARDEAAFKQKTSDLTEKFARLEQRLAHKATQGPWFDGEAFSLVDAVFGSVFRYFDSFDQIKEFGILDNKPLVQAWRKQLEERESIQQAVSKDYALHLWAFLQARESYLTQLMPA